MLAAQLVLCMYSSLLIKAKHCSQTIECTLGLSVSHPHNRVWNWAVGIKAKKKSIQKKKENLFKKKKKEREEKEDIDQILKHHPDH